MTTRSWWWCPLHALPMFLAVVALSHIHQTPEVWGNVIDSREAFTGGATRHVAQYEQDVQQGTARESDLASKSPTMSGARRAPANGLDLELGREYGLSAAKEVPPSVVQVVVQGADQGNRDSLYFLALLKLYGISVSPDEAMALGLMRKAAEQRHPEAIVALGMMLLHGRGGSRDYGAAAAWFKLAATEGHLEAMWLLGRMYYEGKGVVKVDFSEAEKWFHRAASQGSARGQYYMGVLHEYGLGVEKDQRRASAWHVQAARQGLAESEYHMGLMKVHGRGFAQDFSGAAIHFQKAAQQHHAPSMLYLGKMCLHGQGFPVDYDMALLWFERAADEGVPPVSKEATAARDELRFSLLKAGKENERLAQENGFGIVEGKGVHPAEQPLGYLWQSLPK